MSSTEEVLAGGSEISLAGDGWGTVYRILDEFGPMVPILQDCDKNAPALRAFTRWFFSWLETLAFALKRMAAEYARRKKEPLSGREREVLQIMEEPRFPGLPPPRRVEAGLREGLTVALLVYARTRKIEAPLVDGKLPKEFIDASVVFDRLSRPENGLALTVTRADFLAVGHLVVWFRDLQQWLHAQRVGEIEEMKREVHESTAAAIRELGSKRK
jgi:hypothetical protein